MIEKINYIYKNISKIKFPPFMINGSEHNIGYCGILSAFDGHLVLSSKQTGKFTCEYYLIDTKDDIGGYLTDSQMRKSTTIFVHKQFLHDDFREDKMKFILQDGGYKCNLGVVEVYTAASVGGVLQYRDDLIF